MTLRRLKVLHVEDDLLDQRILEKALKRQSIEHDLIATTTAQHAVDILSGSAEAGALQGPTLVLLDLNLPGMSGLEFLAARRKNDALQKCIVIVLTTSNRTADIRQAYQQGAAGYIVKDEAGDGYELVAQLIESLKKTISFP